MAAKHTFRIFLEGGTYHIFNRGVNKRRIFHNDSDYQYFTECLFLSLLSESHLMEYLMSSYNKTKKVIRLIARFHANKNFASAIHLHAFCLMPNHFHLVLSQVGERDMSLFMKSLQIRYSMYYARKYKHIGPLFQGRYRAIYVSNEAYLGIVLHYVHENPSLFVADVRRYEWSSCRDYQNIVCRPWISKVTTL